MRNFANAAFFVDNFIPQWICFYIMAIGLNAVEETLFIPLWSRAHASKKYSTLLSDPKAVELVESIDYNFSSIAEKFDTLYKLSSVVRA